MPVEQGIFFTHPFHLNEAFYRILTGSCYLKKHEPGETGKAKEGKGWYGMMNKRETGKEADCRGCGTAGHRETSSKSNRKHKKTNTHQYFRIHRKQ